MRPSRTPSTLQEPVAGAAAAKGGARSIVGFSSMFPDLSTRDIKCRHLEEFQLELCKRKIVANTVNDYMARLKKIFVWGVPKNYLKHCLSLPLAPYLG